MDQISLVDASRGWFQTAQVRWSSLEAGKMFLEVGQGPDKSSGGIRLVLQMSLEAGENSLESDEFTGQVQ
jgi:hypothetical protein